MNHIYRLVWDKKHGTYKAVGEVAKSQTKNSTRLLIGGTALLLSGFGTAAEQAQIDVASGNTAVFQAPNGVQVIDIATTNAAGVSHNKYHHYNVSKDGLILNNNSPLTQVGPLQSQLGGQVVPNSNLNQEANLIINEVVSANRSSLNGYTEIVGGKADLVVANPYGLTCNGCGFINSDKVTLTTGTPNLDNNGNLATLSVSQGDIAIEGQGLNGTGQKVIDLVARSFKVDAQVNTDDLQVVAGSNTYNYQTRTASRNSADSNTPLFAVDSSALGGMYANRIKIVATEQGVGVRMRGEAAASGDDFTIDASGKILINSRISAERNLAITRNDSPAHETDAIEVNGASAELAAKQNLTITGNDAAGITLSEAKLSAGNNVQIAAESLTDTSTSKQRFAGNQLTVTLDKDAQITGSQWGAGSSTQVSAENATLTNTTLYSGTDSNAALRDTQLTTHGDLTLNNSRLTTEKNITVNSGGNITLDANNEVSSGEDLAIKVAGTLHNQGTINTQGDVSLTTNSAKAALTNEGDVQVNGELTIGAANHVFDVTNSNGASIVTDRLVAKTDALTNSGTLQSTRNSQIDTTSLTNQSTGTLQLTTQSGEDAVLSATQSVANLGTIQSAGAITVTANTTLNNQGKILALSTSQGGNSEGISLTTNQFTNSGEIGTDNQLTVQGSQVTNSGRIQADSAEIIASSQFDNQANGKLLTQQATKITSNDGHFTLNNAGAIQANGNLTLGESGQVVTLTNAAVSGDNGVIRSKSQLSVYADSITNRGSIESVNGTLSLSNALQNHNGATLLSDSNMTIAARSGSVSIDNDGAIQADGNLTIGSTSQRITLDNSSYSNGNGLIKALGNTTLYTQQLTNAGFIETNSGVIDSTAVTNSGLVKSNASLQLSSQGNLTNSGDIQSATMTVTTGNVLTNQASGKIIANNQMSLLGSSSAFSLSNLGSIQSGTNMTLNLGSGDLSNQQNAVIRSGDVLTLTARQLNNQGNITALDSSQFTLTSLQNGASNYSSAVILAGANGASSSTWTVSGDVLNYGALHSNGNWTLNTANINNTNTGGMSALNNLVLTATGDINNYGAFYAGSLLSLSAGDLIQNHTATGTLDSSGNITVNSARFINNHSVVASQDITITTSTLFENATTFANGAKPTKSLSSGSWTGSESRVRTIASEGTAYSDSDIYLYEQNFTRTEYLNGSVPSVKAQIISNGSGGTLRINYGAAGKNTIAVLSAPNINITGTGTFTNEDLTLYKYTYTGRWIYLDDNYVCGFSTCDYKRYWGRTDANRSGYNSPGSDYEWDEYDPGSGWGSRHTSKSDAKDDALRGGVQNNVVSVESFGAGIFATNSLIFTGGAFNNIGSPYASDDQKARQDSAQSGTVNTTSQNTTGAVSANGSSGQVNNAAPSDILGSVIASLPPLSFGSISISLPTNPNGYFVLSKSPQAKYLIETNPLFNVGSNFVGSDYLARRYGINPDDTVRRLGDAGYEAYLIRQQLIAETGGNLITGQTDEASQMQKLMDNAFAQSQKSGFEYGKALTPQQIANLTDDIVWMEPVNVGGQIVLAPRVYLSAKTKSMLSSGAVVAANNLSIDADSVTNTGGTIEGRETLGITSKGDITNTSGTIKGGNVSLTSTEGSIINETLAQGAGDDITYDTVIGKQAGIQASGNLNLDAKKDIKVIGADVSANGDASLAAGGEVRFDTIVDKTTRSSTSESGLFQKTVTNETVSTSKHRGSSLNVGNNLSISSGKDTVIAGSDVNVGGNLDTDIKGNLRIEARQDQETRSKQSTTSGLGVGGGLYGTQVTTENSFTGTNKGSTINVGGNANVKADGSLVMQGSDLDIKGNADIKAKQGVQILDGLDEKYSTTRTETTTLLKFEGSSDSDSSSSAGKASANAGANGDFDLAETKTTVTETGSITSVKSNLNVGGNLSLNTDGNMLIQGSDINVGGNGDINAKNIDVAAGRNESWSSTSTTTQSYGLFSENDSGANAGTAGSGEKPAGYADSGASANASSTLTTGVKTENSSESEYSLTHTETGLNIGGNLNITAKEKARFEGVNVEAGNNLNIDAKDIENVAAKDIHLKSSSSDTKTAGLYLSAEAGANASASEPGVSAEAQAGLRYKTTQNSASEGSVTNQTNTFKAGGDFNRTAANTIVDEGTQVEAGGNISQSAKTIIDREVHDTTFSSNSNSSYEARAGVYAGAEASPEGKSASAGVQGSFEGEAGSGQNSSATAVTSSFKAGGNITSKSEDKTTLTGTQFEAGGDITVEAGKLEYNAARDYQNSSGENAQGAVQGKVALYGETGGSLEGSYEQGSSQSNSSQAQTGSLNAGGNITLKSTKGDLTLEGTDINSGQQTQIGAAGNVNINAAYDTSSASSDSMNASVSLSTSKAKSGDKSSSASAGAGFSESESSSRTGKASAINAGGGITITSGNGDVNLEGTDLNTEKDINLQASGDVNLNALKNSSESSSSGASVEVSASSKTGNDKKTNKQKTTDTKSGSLSLEGSDASSETGKGVNLNSGGNINIKAGGDIKAEGTQSNAEGTTTLDAGGNIVESAIENRSDSTEASVSVTAKSSSEKGIKGNHAYGSGSYSNSEQNSTQQSSFNSGAGVIRTENGN